MSLNVWLKFLKPGTCNLRLFFSDFGGKNMRENYSATETLGTLLGTTIRRGRFAVLKDAKSEGDTTPDDSPVEDIVASAAEEQEG